MAAEFPYVTLGRQDVIIADGSGNTGNFPMVRNSWSPAIASWRRSFLGNQPPYDDVTEEFRVNVRGSTVAEVLGNVRNLNLILNQAEQWFNNDVFDLPVLINYAPQGSTISSVDSPLQSVLLGRAQGNETNLNLTDRFNDAGIIKEVDDVRVRFLRRGPWLSSATQSTGFRLPEIAQAQASLQLATELTRIATLDFGVDSHHTWSPMSLEWMLFPVGTPNFSPPDNVGSLVMMVSDSDNIYRIPGADLGGQLVVDDSSPDGFIKRFQSFVEQGTFTVTGDGISFDYNSASIGPRNAKWLAAVITARASASGGTRAIVDIGLQYQFGISNQVISYVTANPPSDEEYTSLYVIPLVAQPENAQSLTVQLAHRIRQGNSTIDVDHVALLAIQGRGENLLVFGSVPPSTPGVPLSDFVYSYWIVRDQTNEAVSPDAGNFDHQAYTFPLNPQIKYEYVNNNVQGNLSMQNRNSRISVYIQALERDRFDFTLCETEDNLPLDSVPMYYRARANRRLAYLVPE